MFFTQCVTDINTCEDEGVAAGGVGTAWRGKGMRKDLQLLMINLKHSSCNMSRGKSIVNMCNEIFFVMKHSSCNVYF